MRILALDMGDVWIGSALSDPLQFFAKPFQTVKAHKLEDFLTETIKTMSVGTIVVGYPKTLRGTESQQTKKIVAEKERLEKLFTSVDWVLWDERLTSKMASSLKKEKKKEHKQKSHSIAAAFILDSYLLYLQNKKNMQ